MNTTNETVKVEKEAAINAAVSDLAKLLKQEYYMAPHETRWEAVAKVAFGFMVQAHFEGREKSNGRRGQETQESPPSV